MAFIQIAFNNCGEREGELYWTNYGVVNVWIESFRNLDKFQMRGKINVVGKNSLSLSLSLSLSFFLSFFLSLSL